jgi:sugar lactone lactonase YvrE
MAEHRYPATPPTLAAGWTSNTVREPSSLFGANGMRVGPDGALYVAQAFGSQVSALDPETGAATAVVPVGGEVVAPDDLAFDSHGVLYMTEVMSERVSARMPNGDVRVIADNVPVANGITIHDDRIFMDEFRLGGRVLELYADGRAPRVIAEDLVTPNALAMGPDGALYFPQVMAGEIWRVAIDGGRPERVMAGLAIPTAVKFSPSGELFTTEAGSGDITRIDLHTIARTVVGTVRPGIDNFAFTPDGRLFVSHFTDGGVAEIDSAGKERVIVNGGLLGPFGLASAPDHTLYISDGMSLVVVAPDGHVASRPALMINADFPGFVRSVCALDDGCYLTTTAGTIARYRPGQGIEVVTEGLGNLSGIACTRDGQLLACETDTGRVLQISTTGQTTTLARGLQAPTGIAARADGSCVVSASGAGQLVHIKDGVVSVMMSGLQDPHGVAVLGDDTFVLDRGARTLTRFNHTSVQSDIIASGLALGANAGITPKVLPGIDDLLPGPLLPFADLSATSDGRLLVGCDGAGSVIAIAPAVTG